MRNLIVIILISFCITARCQNLVPNPSFEVITECPWDNNAIIFAKPWYNPTVTSPDLYNVCSPYNIRGVPKNLFGYQKARTGVGYTGILTHALEIIPNRIQREYISVRLINSLDSNKTYGIHFYVSLADSTSYANDRMGIFISKDSIFGHIFRPLPYIPQIQSDSGIILKDTMNWTPIYGVYKALGGERVITIGNFYNDSLTNFEYLGYSRTYLAAYYFIDDVSVYEITDPIYTAEAGENSIICRKDSVVLGSPAHPNYRYRWKPAHGLSSDTIAQPVAKPFITTTYHLTQYDYTDLETYDSVTVTVKNCDSTVQYNGLIIYPNPSQGEFFIEFSSYVPEHARFTISNTLGQVLIKSDITREERKKLVNTGFLATGVYFVKVYESDNLLKSEKVVKIGK